MILPDWQTAHCPDAEKPTVVDFIDIAMMGTHPGRMMEEATIGDNCSLIGKKEDLKRMKAVL